MNSILVIAVLITTSLALNEDCLVPPTKTPKDHEIKSLPQTIPMSIFLSSTEKLDIHIVFKGREHSIDSDHLVISCEECIVHRMRNRNRKTENISCSDITAGWHQANISVTETVLSIGSFLNHSLDYETSYFNTTADNVIYFCEKNSPTWNITETMPINIPLLRQGKDILTLESYEQFSPILHVLGNTISISWKKETLAISKGPPLPQGEYVIAIHNTTERTILNIYSKSCNCEASLTNLGDPLDELGISSSKGTFQSILHLNNSIYPTELKEAIINELENQDNTNDTITIIIISLFGGAILTGCAIIVCLYIVKKKRSTQNNNDNLERQPFLKQKHVKVDKREIIENFSHLTVQKNSFIKKYKLEMREDHRNSEKKVQKLSLGPIDPDLPTKTILILGETGTGKSTTINTMVNHIFGIELEDTERFVLIENETEGKKFRFESQTDFMTAYVFPYKNGMPNCCNYIIIDTPGFGDTHGFERDQKIMLQLESFLKQDYNISHIDVAGFVVKASAPRLTIAQRYIYDGLLSMFGKDISHNMFLLVTFAAKDRPPVLDVLQETGIQYRNYFKLNTDSLYQSYRENETDEMNFHQSKRIKYNWNLTKDSLRNFFEMLPTMNPVSLSLTKIVIEENTQLRSVVGFLQSQIKEGLDKITQLKSKQIESVKPEETKIVELEISHTEERLISSIKDAQRLTKRLKEIPLRLDPLSVHGYIELLISNEHKEKYPNYVERVQILEKLKEENIVLKAVINNENISGKSWLSYFQKLKED